VSSSRAAPDPGTAPRAILIGGAPGTGKSTLAAALAPRLGAAVLDLDVATGPLVAVVSDLIGATDLSDPRLAHLTRGPRYETLYALAEENLRAGISVILVAPFTIERSEDGWTGVTARLGAYAAEPLLVWLHLAPDQHIERLSRRNAVRDADKVANPAAFLGGIDTGRPAAPHLALDAATPPAEMADRVIAFVAIDGNT
jgi:predicted kinase